MRRAIPQGLLILLVLACTGVAQGAAILAPDNVVRPADVACQTPYHVIFRSSDPRDASGIVIGEYDAFVQGLATVAGLGEGWRAIVSTSAMNAYDHLAPLFSDLDNVPIYDQTGVRIADSFNDMWDGSILAPIRKTEWGVNGIMYGQVPKRTAPRPACHWA